MNSNPYAPPKTPVTDSQFDAEAVYQQPTAVRVAVWIVWFLLGATLTAAMFLTVLKQYSWNAFARIQGLLQIVVFVLLLTPSAARWFRRKRNNDTAVTIRT